MNPAKLLERIRAAAKRLHEQAMPHLARSPLGSLATPPVHAVKPKGGNWIDFEREVMSRERTRNDTGTGYRWTNIWEPHSNFPKYSGLQENIEHLRMGYLEPFNRIGGLEPGVEDAMHRWFDKQLPKYLKTHWGSPEDPLADALVRGELSSDAFGAATIDDIMQDWRDAQAAHQILPMNRTKNQQFAAQDYREDPRDFFTRGTILENIPPRLRGELEGSLVEYGVHGSLGNDERIKLPKWLKPEDAEQKKFFDLTAGPGSFYDMMGEQFQPMVDYMRTLRPEQIDRLSVPDAFRNAKRWHDELAKKMTNQVVEAGGAKEVLDLGNGYKWLELTSDDALNAEGKMMGHCVGSYCDQVREGNTRILSLRDSQGKPHVTIELRPQPHGTDGTGSDAYTPEALADLEVIASKYMPRGELPDSMHEFPHITMRNRAQWWSDPFFDGQRKNHVGEEISKPDSLLEALDEWEAKHPSLHPGIVHQIKGKQNAAPIAEYVPMVQRLLNARGYDHETHDLDRMGLVPIEHGGRKWYGTKSQVAPYAQFNTGIWLPVHQGNIPEGQKLGNSKGFNVKPKEWWTLQDALDMYTAPDAAIRYTPKQVQDAVWSMVDAPYDPSRMGRSSGSPKLSYDLIRFVLPDDFQGFAAGGSVSKKREKLPHETLGYRLKQLRKALPPLDAYLDYAEGVGGAAQRWGRDLFQDLPAAAGELVARRGAGHDIGELDLIDQFRTGRAKDALARGTELKQGPSAAHGVGEFVGELVDPSWALLTPTQLFNSTAKLGRKALPGLRSLAEKIVPGLNDPMGGLASYVQKPKGGNWVDWKVWDSRGEAPKRNVSDIDRLMTRQMEDMVSGAKDVGDVDIKYDALNSSPFGKYMRTNVKNYMLRNAGSPDDPLASTLFDLMMENKIGWGQYKPGMAAEYYRTQWLPEQQRKVHGPVDPRDFFNQPISEFQKHPQSGLLLKKISEQKYPQHGGGLPRYIDEITGEQADPVFSTSYHDVEDWVRDKLQPGVPVYQPSRTVFSAGLGKRQRNEFGSGSSPSVFDQIRSYVSGMESPMMPQFRELAKTDKELAAYLKQHFGKKQDFSWDKLKNISVQDLVKQAANRRDAELGIKRRKAVELGHADPVRDYDDFRWLSLKHPEALDDEGNMMGHCVGGNGYCEAVKRGSKMILALRDKKTGRSHATVDLSLEKQSMYDWLRNIPRDERNDLLRAMGFQDNEYNLVDAISRKIQAQKYKARRARYGENEYDAYDFNYALQDSDDALLPKDKTVADVFKDIGLADLHGKYLEAVSKPMATISQIKWNRNQAVPEKYQPYIQDLIVNAPNDMRWGRDIGDFASTGFVKPFHDKRIYRKDAFDKLFKMGDGEGFNQTLDHPGVSDEQRTAIRADLWKAFTDAAAFMTPEERANVTPGAFKRVWPELKGYRQKLTEYNVEPVENFAWPEPVKIPFAEGYAGGGMVKANQLRDELGPTLREIEKHHKLPAMILNHLAEIESNWNPKAVSKKGAKGLFQLMPITQKELGVADPHDPYESAWAAGRYLSKQLQQFKSIDQALGAYNWGPTNMRKYGLSKAPAETQNYVGRLTAMLDTLSIPEPAKAVIKAQQGQQPSMAMGAPALPDQTAGAGADPMQDPEIRLLLAQLLETGEEEMA